MIVRIYGLIIVRAQREGLGGHGAADTVLDGDGLHGGGNAQAEGLAVEIALCGGGVAVSGVTDFGSCRAGDAHLGALLKRSGTADHRSIHGSGLGAAVVTGVGTAVGAGVAATALGLGSLSPVGGPLALRQHGTGLLTGSAVNEVVAEENLRGSGTGSTVLGYVVSVDVNDSVAGLFHHLDGNSLVVGAGDTVGLAFGSLNHEEDATVVGQILVQFEGEYIAVANQGGAGGILNTHQCRRVYKGSSATGYDPIVQAGEQVGARDLGLGAKHRAALLREGEFIPGENLGTGQRLPLGGKLLKNALHLSLVRSAYRATVTAVADVLAALHLSGRNALGAAAHLLEGDAWNVLHRA